MVDRAVAQRLGDREVRVLKTHVLADQGDAHRLGLPGVARLVDQRLPLGQVRRTGLDAEVLEDRVVDALLAVDQRHLVDVA